MNNATTPAAQANARDTATPTQPGFRSANFRATKYGTPTPTNIANNVGAIGDPLMVGGTLRYYSPRRNPTSTPCKHHSSSGAGRTACHRQHRQAWRKTGGQGCQHCWHAAGANQNWYGMADRFQFMACPGAPKVAKTKLRFHLNTLVIVLSACRNLGYSEPSSVRGHCEGRLRRGSPEFHGSHSRKLPWRPGGRAQNAHNAEVASGSASAGREAATATWSATCTPLVARPGGPFPATWWIVRLHGRAEAS